MSDALRDTGLVFGVLPRRPRLTALPSGDTFGGAKVARGDGRTREGTDGEDGSTAAHGFADQGDVGAAGRGGAVASVEGAGGADSTRGPRGEAAGRVPEASRADAHEALPVTEARALLGGARDLTDEQVQALVDGFNTIAEVVCDEATRRRGHLHPRI